MKRGAPLSRKTPLGRGAAPLRRTPLARVSAAKRTVAKQRARRDTGPDAATKALLWERARGCCERCGRDLTAGYPFSRQHRRARGNGGSSVTWINDITNLLLVCGSATSPGDCHHYIEHEGRQEAYDAGWAVRMNSQYEPAELPVLVTRRFAGVLSTDLVYLTADGGYAKGIA